MSPVSSEDFTVDMQRITEKAQQELHVIEKRAQILTRLIKEVHPLIEQIENVGINKNASSTAFPNGISSPDMRTPVMPSAPALPPAPRLKASPYGQRNKRRRIKRQNWTKLLAKLPDTFTSLMVRQLNEQFSPAYVASRMSMLVKKGMVERIAYAQYRKLEVH